MFAFIEWKRKKLRDANEGGGYEYNKETGEDGRFMLRGLKRGGENKGDWGDIYHGGIRNRWSNYQNVFDNFLLVKSTE